MANIKLFLETSTIHGLSHIATNRSLTKILWIFIVTTGFLLASSLIITAFQSWAKAPISTTIETVSINQIKFPKVNTMNNQFTTMSRSYFYFQINNLWQEIFKNMFMF